MPQMPPRDLSLYAYLGNHQYTRSTSLHLAARMSQKVTLLGFPGPNSAFPNSGLIGGIAPGAVQFHLFFPFQGQQKFNSLFLNKHTEFSIKALA